MEIHGGYLVAALVIAAVLIVIGIARYNKRNP